MNNVQGSPHLEALADTLWAERRVVEVLLFKLVTAKLVLEASERRFVTLAMDEVQHMLGTLRSSEVQRSAALEPVAAAWGCPPDDLTLSELANRSPSPMDAVFRDHHEAFLEMAVEIEETARTNSRLASASLTDVRSTLDALTGPPLASTYTAAGTHDTPVARPVRLDEVL